MNIIDDIDNTLKEQSVRGMLKYSPLIFLVFGILAYIVTGTLGYLMFTVYVIITIITVDLIKGLFLKSTDKIVLRPENNNCGLGLNEKIKNIGMPSGHSAVAAMFATLIIAYIWKSKGYTLTKIVRTVLLLSLALTIIISRVTIENCHTVPQVLAGSSLGIILGLLFYWFSTFLPAFLKI